MRIDGKVVLITGASEGIGAACARAFEKRGARLSLIARNSERLAAGRRAGRAAHRRRYHRRAEIRRTVVDRTIERFGEIDILINNAGMGMYSPAWSAPMAEVRRMFELNLFAPLALAQLVVPHMRERRQRHHRQRRLHRRQSDAAVVHVVLARPSTPWVR